MLPVLNSNVTSATSAPSTSGITSTTSANSIVNATSTTSTASAQSATRTTSAIRQQLGRAERAGESISQRQDKPRTREACLAEARKDAVRVSADHLSAPRLAGEI